MVAVDQVTQQRLDATLAACARRAGVVAAYFFGSRAEGRADEWSDYDIALFVEGAEEWDMVRKARFCAAVQEQAGDDMELHVFPASQHAAPHPASFAAWVKKEGVALAVPFSATT